MTENKYVCPICGEPLEKDYINANGEQVWYCPNGDEEFVFRAEGEYMYAVSTYNGKKICMGTAKGW